MQSTKVDFTVACSTLCHIFQMFWLKVTIAETINNLEKCSKKFRDNSTLNVHRRSDHLNCDICEKNFESKESILQHLKNAHAIDYTCNTCGKGYFTKKTLMRHEACSHRGKTEATTCVKCSKAFFNQETRNYHLKSVHWFCYICNKDFASKESITQHMKDQHAVDYYTCEICNTRFFNRSTLLRHEEESHRESKEFRCDTCTFVTQSKQGFDKHRKKCQISQKDCSICGFKASSKIEYLDKTSTKRTF